MPFLCRIALVGPSSVDYRCVGTHGSGVRPHGKERPYTRLQKQMHMFIGAGARAVRPYISSSGSSSRAQ